MPGPSRARLIRNATQSEERSQREEYLTKASKRAGTEFRRRIASVVQNAGGPRKLGRLSGVPHNTISAWLLKGDGFPSLDKLWRVAFATGKSTDWLLGYDVAEDREEGVDRPSAEPIRSALVHDLAVNLGLGKGFIAAALPEAEGDLRRHLLDEFGDRVRQLAWRKRAQETIDRLEAVGRTKSARGSPIGAALGEAIQAMDANRRRTERAAVARLPPTSD